MLIKQKEIGLTDDDIVVILWDMMAGGIDTTATSMEILIYLLINHPAVQKKLHDELDAVVGPSVDLLLNSFSGNAEGLEQIGG